MLGYLPFMETLIEVGYMRHLSGMILRGVTELGIVGRRIFDAY